jgi:hypothetical protein
MFKVVSKGAARIPLESMKAYLTENKVVEENQIEKLVAEVNTNSDREIDLDEFCNGWHKMQKGAGSSSSSGGGGALKSSGGGGALKSDSALLQDTIAKQEAALKEQQKKIEELQAKYLAAVGRATGSDDRRYLIWKIREAEKGRIPVGPRKTRERNGEPVDVKILPLRLEAEVVERMDEAWRTRGIKNRMEFFRRALGHYLSHLGAEEAAALFTNAGAASA